MHVWGCEELGTRDHVGCEGDQDVMGGLISNLRPF